MRGHVAQGSDKTLGDTLIPDTSFATPTHAQSITTLRSCGCVSETVVYAPILREPPCATTRTQTQHPPLPAPSPLPDDLNGRAGGSDRAVCRRQQSRTPAWARADQCSLGPDRTRNCLLYTSPSPRD